MERDSAGLPAADQPLLRPSVIIAGPVFFEAPPIRRALRPRWQRLPVGRRWETDIIQGIYAGKTNQEIADQLFITIQTVKDHSSRIYQKTQVKNRTQLAALLRDTQAQIHSHKSGKN